MTRRELIASALALAAAPSGPAVPPIDTVDTSGGQAALQRHWDWMVEQATVSFLLYGCVVTRDGDVLMPPPAELDGTETVYQRRDYWPGGQYEGIGHLVVGDKPLAG